MHVGHSLLSATSCTVCQAVCLPHGPQQKDWHLPWSTSAPHLHGLHGKLASKQFDPAHHCLLQCVDCPTVKCSIQGTCVDALISCCTVDSTELRYAPRHSLLLQDNQNALKSTTTHMHDSHRNQQPQLQCGTWSTRPWLHADCLFWLLPEVLLDWHHTPAICIATWLTLDFDWGGLHNQKRPKNPAGRSKAKLSRPARLPTTRTQKGTQTWASQCTNEKHWVLQALVDTVRPSPASFENTSIAEAGSK